MSTATLKTVGVPKGVKWNPTMKAATPRTTTRTRAGSASKQSETLAELNKRLAESRGARLKAAEANCLKVTGSSRL